jgi:hypothetical protein
MTCGELNVRTENVHSWLRMLKHCNPKYWNMIINESEACKQVMTNLSKELLENVELVDNECSINIEKVITSDTADVRGIQKDELYTNINFIQQKLSLSSTMLYNDNNERKESLLSKKALNGIGERVMSNVINVVRYQEIQ